MNSKNLNASKKKLVVEKEAPDDRLETTDRDARSN
jgi:hypothetical protein